MPVLYEDSRVRIHKVPASPYDNNAYLVVCRETGEGVIIDAPREAGKVLEEARGVRVRAILITHNHFDHLEGLEELVRGTGAPVWLHPADAHALPSPPGLDLRDGDTVEVGRVSLRVLHTPGHTPGSTCFLVGRHLFSGDTLFPGGPGRTETPEAFRQTVRSITERLLPLPEDTVVCPGHGADTTIGEARREYRVFASRPHPPDLCGDVLWLES